MTLQDVETVLVDVVARMMKERNIEDYTFHIDGGTSKADGYLGDIIFFHVIYNNKKEHLVLKASKQNEDLRRIMNAENMYQREVCMYTKVIPMLEKFTNGKGISVFPSMIPQIMYCQGETIVMENIKAKDFHSLVKDEPMNMAHMKLLFESYATWHGITMAFKDQHPDEFSECVKNWEDARNFLNGTFGFTKHFTEEFSKVMKTLELMGRNDLIEVYKKYESQIDDYLFRRQLKEEDSLIISHGDSWTTNFLFKYKDKMRKDEPIQMYLIDFQFSKPESPATELAHAFYNMADENCFKNFDKLLNIYHRKLSETLRSLGSDPKKLFTLDDLKRHWKQYSFFSVLYTFIYVRMIHCDLDEAPDFTMMAKNGENFVGTFDFELKKMDLFWKRVLTVFIHFGDFLIKNS